MRVLLLNYEFPPIGGGGANATMQLLTEFSRYPQIQVDLVTSGMGSEPLCERFSDNITIYKLPVGKKALHYWTYREIFVFLYKAEAVVRKLIQHKQYDLTHSIFGFPSGWLSWRNRKTLPYVISLRGSDVPGFNPRFSKIYGILTPLFRRIWRDADAVFANSQGLKRLASDTWPDGDIGVVPNGINGDEFTPASCLTDNEILCVSRLVERKGVHHLLQALPRILTEIPDAKLSIIGSGNQYEELQELAKEQGIERQVNFHGAVLHNDLPNYYQKASIYVQPSFYEGMSNTILEAMSSGLPIVTSAEGGVEELLHENAHKVPYADPEAIAEAVISLLKNREEAERMGAASRTIAEQFTWSAVADRYIEVYQKISGGVCR